MISTSPYRSPRRSKHTSEMPLFVACIAILLIALFVFGIDRISGGAVRSYAHEGGNSMWAAAAGAASFIGRSGGFESRSALVDTNRQLAETVATQGEAVSRMSALESENEILRLMANLSSKEPGVTVPVLSSFSSSPYGTFHIGGGSREGIEEGSIVLTPGGYILGAVTSVSAKAAIVEAFFAPNKKIEMNVDGTPFMAEGRGGGNARGEIPRDAITQVGSVVTIPAFGGRPAGVIGSIESASSSARTTIFIRIPRNLDSLHYVYVLPL